MAFYFSAANLSFYDTSIFPEENLPSDSVEISSEVYAELLEKQNAGYVIAADESGNPYAVSQGCGTCECIKHEVTHASESVLGHVKIGAGISVDEEGRISAAIGTAEISDGSVTESKLAKYAVTTDKIAARSVGTDEVMIRELKGVNLQEKTITDAELADKAVTTDKIAADSVTSEKIADRLDLNVKSITGGNGGVRGTYVDIDSAKISVDLDVSLIANLGNGGFVVNPEEEFIGANLPIQSTKDIETSGNVSAEEINVKKINGTNTGTTGNYLNIGNTTVNGDLDVKYNALIGGNLFRVDSDYQSVKIDASSFVLNGIFLQVTNGTDISSTTGEEGQIMILVNKQNSYATVKISSSEYNGQVSVPAAGCKLVIYHGCWRTLN